jgi:hypothetical protein
MNWIGPMAIFLCVGFKNRVWSVSDRLGSFGRISFIADVLFHKKDQKREKTFWQSFCPFAFGTSTSRDTAANPLIDLRHLNNRPVI